MESCYLGRESLLLCKIATSVISCFNMNSFITAFAYCSAAKLPTEIIKAVVVSNLAHYFKKS